MPAFAAIGAWTDHSKPERQCAPTVTIANSESLAGIRVP
jgi:hypothetical protein